MNVMSPWTSTVDYGVIMVFIFISPLLISHQYLNLTEHNFSVKSSRRVDNYGMIIGTILIPRNLYVSILWHYTVCNLHPKFCVNPCKKNQLATLCKHSRGSSIIATKSLQLNPLERNQTPISAFLATLYTFAYCPLLFLSGGRSTEIVSSPPPRLDLFLSFSSIYFLDSKLTLHTWFRSKFLTVRQLLGNCFYNQSQLLRGGCSQRSFKYILSLTLDTVI